MYTVNSLTIDWSRSLQIDSPIDEELVRLLTPKILSLRQESREPITIGINSPGGSLASLDILLELLTGPDQDGNIGQIITVATNRAYSAAANFLAFGSYAVALRHSQVLYHDVRFGGMEDVTPEKARVAAKALQEKNDTFALRLAHKIISRLIWVYIDLQGDFKKIEAAYPNTHKKYTSIVSAFVPQVDGYDGVDLACFATALWARLSLQNDTLITSVMERLLRWINLMNVAKDTPTYRKKGSRTAGLLDGVCHLYKTFDARAENFRSSEESMKLLICLIVADISSAKEERVNFPLVLDQAVREYGILDSMNDPSHVEYASTLMLQYPSIFFGHSAAGEAGSRTEEEEAEIRSRTAPYARLFWHFCVLLCRELFEGEHILKPADAQLLGLVDEVAGGGPIESLRDYRIAQQKKVDAAEKS